MCLYDAKGYWSKYIQICELKLTIYIISSQDIHIKAARYQYQQRDKRSANVIWYSYSLIRDIDGHPKIPCATSYPYTVHIYVGL